MLQKGNILPEWTQTIIPALTDSDLIYSVRQYLNTAGFHYIQTLLPKWQSHFPSFFQYMEDHHEIDILGAWVKAEGKVQKSGGCVPTEWRYTRMLFDNVGIYHPTAFIRKLKNIPDPFRI